MPRIVVADDNEGTAALLEVLLTVAGVGDVVGVARDGIEAIDLVLASEADLALLDVEMPRLRGTQAAEAIRTYRPQTRVVLHTASVDETLHDEARALGVTLVDKLGVAGEALEDVISAELAAPAGWHRPRDVESVVLVALERRPNEAMIVVTADERVAFYDRRAAEILELPFPPRSLAMDELRTVFTPQSAERPLFAALRSQSDAEGIVYERAGDELLTIRARAVAFHDAEGTFLGVAVYWTELERRARRPPPMCRASSCSWSKRSRRSQPG